MTDYINQIDDDVLFTTVDRFTSDTPHNMLLLIHEDKCVGVLAGIEVKSSLNNDIMFQEIMWYVEKPFGKYGFYFVREAEKILKGRGFSSIIMSVFESPNIDRIKNIYNRMGFKHMESHYIRSIA